MATVRQVIEARLAVVSVVPDKITMNALLVENDLEDGAMAYTKAHLQSVRAIQLSILSDLIVKKIQEGAMSIEFDMDRIKARCDELRKELGLPVDGEAIVRNRSNCW